MPSVTALSPTKRDPSRISIKVDGKYVGTVPDDQLKTLGITIGTEWHDDLASHVVGAVAFGKALNSAMSGIARRMMSNTQLRRKLRDKGHEDPVIDRVLERLNNVGLMDDEAFGRALISDQMKRKPAGPALLRSKLYEKGVDRSLIEKLVDEACEQTDLVADAIRLAESKVRTMRRLDDATRRRRLYGALARRGFKSDTIRTAMEHVLSAIAEDDDEFDDAGNSFD